MTNIPKTDNKEYEVTSLFVNTDALFRNAITILKTKKEIAEYNDADPSDLDIEILNYAAGVDMLDELVVDDMFVDEEAFDLVYGMIEKFHIYVKHDYRMLGKLSQYFLHELDNHRKLRFDS